MSRTAVVDCSALFDFLIAAGGADLHQLLIESNLHAPHLIDYEFLASLRNHVTRDRIGASDATDKLEQFTALRIERHGIDLLRNRMWSLRHSITPYDASYVTLAEALDIPLVTTDRRLAKAASKYCEVLTP